MKAIPPYETILLNAVAAVEDLAVVVLVPFPDELSVDFTDRVDVARKRDDLDAVLIVDTVEVAVKIYNPAGRATYRSPDDRVFVGGREIFVRDLYKA